MGVLHNIPFILLYLLPQKMKLGDEDYSIGDLAALSLEMS